MAQYFYGTDLYNDLFLNNNRELYIKMFLLESTEPEAADFYIKSSDVSGGVASNIIVPYGKYDYTELTANLCPTNISGQTSPYNLIFANSSPSNSRGSFVYTPTITSGTFLIKSDIVIYPTDGRTGHFAQVIITYSDATTETFYNYEVDPDARLRSIAFLITSNPAKSISTIAVYFLNYTGGTGTRTCQALNIELKQISLNDYTKLAISDGDSISFNTIEVDVTRGSTIALGSTFLCGEYVYINLPITNFYTSSINLIYSRSQTGLLSLNGVNGTAYELNKTHKLFFANKQIEGRIINGSLKADGNSPMRRSLDFSCIVDREFTTSSDLKLHDFDNKKIKVLIGIKDTTIGENGYDYYSSYSDNGMQKDLNEIVWFKLGTFIPQNISIKHGVESYSISITAQDKMSALDGSFGGALGTGLEFKDPASGQNTNFYDTILDSITKFSTEKTENINIKFVDDFTIFKNPPTTGNFITAGSTILYVVDSNNLFPGMEIESPGIYSGTKVVDVGVGRVFMDYTAYQTIGPTDAIFADKTQVVLGVSFTSPSYKNNFGIEPLTNNNTESPTPVFFKQATIAFKGSTYTYGITGGIYTSIVNWSPTTWGPVLENQKKPYLNSVFSGEEIYLTGQAVGSSLYTSGNLKIGDYIATQGSIGGLNAALLDIYQYYIVTNVSTHDGSFTVNKINWNAASSPVTFTTEVKNEKVLVQKFDFLYTSSIASYKAIRSIAYNRTNSRFVVATDFSGAANLISNYNSYSNNSSVLTYSYDCSNTQFIISNMAIGKDTMYIVDNVRNIISGHDLGGGPNIIDITSQTIAGAPAITGSSFFYSSSTTTPAIGQAVSIKNANGLELRNNAIYYIKQINTTNKSFSLIDSQTELPVIVTSNITATVVAVCAPIMIGPFTDSILGSSVDKNQDLIICGLGTEITKYTLNKTTNKLVASKQSFYEREYRLLDSDSNNNVYALSDTRGILTKLNPSLTRTLSITISEIWRMVDSKAVFSTYPLITSLSIDDNDNICLVTEGSNSSPS